MCRLLFWNCRGLGSPEVVRSLTDLVRQNSPYIIFLCETDIWESEMRKIQRRLNFDHGVWVDAVGRAGGVALFWSNDVDIHIRSMGQRFIDFEVKSDSGVYWREIGV